MKVAILLALVACIASSTYSSPTTHAVDWSAAETKAREICSLVQEAVDKIRSIIIADNPQNGIHSVGSQFDALAAKAKEVCGRLVAGTVAQTLTVGEARGLLTEMQDIFAGFMSDLQDQVSPPVRIHVVDCIYELYAAIAAKAQELYAILSA